MTQDTLFDEPAPTCPQCNGTDLVQVTGLPGRWRCGTCCWLVRLDDKGRPTDGTPWRTAGRKRKRGV